MYPRTQRIGGEYYKVQALVHALRLKFVSTDIACSNPTVPDNFATSILSITFKEK